MQVDFTGRIAWVTGAARGIGAGIAEAMARGGATVVCADVDVDGVCDTADRIGGLAQVLDISDPDAVAAAAEEIRLAHGRLDILINNAGVNTMRHRVTIDLFPETEWDRIVDIDLKGTYLMSKAAIPLLRGSDAPRIVNIASIVGLVPLRLQCAFAAAKAGMVNLTKAMAIELGSEGILVNAVAPGSTLTEGTKQLFYGDGGMFRESVQRMLDHVPLGRPGSVDEIARATCFLADPESSYITGHCLVVDGGWTAGYHRDF
ncbi:MAG: SDR family NAD(P)-dependent oxidoreductase [Armatimonadota bacterium]